MGSDEQSWPGSTKKTVAEKISIIQAVLLGKKQYFKKRDECDELIRLAHEVPVEHLPRDI
jgi:hypothetical protein